MCGICGICHTDRQAVVDRALLKKMTDALAHRGPDGDGYLLRGHVGFGHRRLSIIDIDGGDQPIFNEDESISIILNGEIYNYLELMDQLRARGHVFRTRSDTETIVHLYEDYGERCVEHLRGMFAFAIFDARKQCVLLARDRLGIKPLFYAELEDRMIFASEMKAILEDCTVPRSIDLSALAEYTAYGYVPGDRCIMHGIAKLQPGCTLKWEGGKTRVHQYWSLDSPAELAPVGDDPEGDIDAALMEAVRLHMRADVPVGVLLSGGVDSATMVALASQVVDRPVKTFSVGFHEDDMSELPVARLTAERYQTEHHEILVTDRDVSVLSDIVRHLDEPFADPSALPMYYVCREAARSVKVCLTGDGADEIFAGYTRYREFLSYRYIDWIPRPIRQALFLPLALAMPNVMWGKGLLRRMASDEVERYMGQIGIFSSPECAALMPDHETARLVRPIERYLCCSGAHRGEPVARLQYVDQRTYLPDDILVKADRMSMQNSLELRPPFLDHRLVSLANCCASSLKIGAGSGKRILKSLMKERIPHEVLERPKTGFGSPIKHWFRGGLAPLAREMVLSPSSRAAAYYERRTMERIISGHQYGLRDLSRRIWLLLVFEHWCREFAI